MTPLVSILIPAYNAERWIAETLRSALEQTWPNKEIIVVDDGSSDRTVEIARQSEGGQLRLVRQENAGAAAARNTAFAQSSGDYIQYLDADDLLGADKIERQLHSLGAEDDDRTLLSGAWAPFRHRPEKAQFVPSALWQNLSSVDWLIRQMEGGLHMQTATWLTSRRLIEAAGPWRTDLAVDDDGEFFCRVIIASKGIRFVPEAKVFYRMSGWNRLSQIGFSDRKKDSQFASMQMHINYLRSLEDSPRVHAACVRYLQTWMIHFYPERPDIVEKAEALAQSFGGHVEPPRLSWKYRWIRDLFGWDFAKRAQLQLPTLKGNVLGSIDALLHRTQKSNGRI